MSHENIHTHVCISLSVIWQKNCAQQQVATNNFPDAENLVRVVFYVWKCDFHADQKAREQGRILSLYMWNAHRQFYPNSLS